MISTLQNNNASLLVDRLSSALRKSRRILRDGARDLPNLSGVSQGGKFSKPMENVLLDAADHMVGSKKIFSYGNRIVIEFGAERDKLIRAIASDGILEKNASSLMANIFRVEQDSANEDSPPSQFAPPNGLLSCIVNNENIIKSFPKIERYSRRPCFDDDFIYRDGGVESWHPDVGYLIHCPSIDPILPPAQQGSSMENIPARLRQLLTGFLFRSEVDLVNTIAVMLTGILAGQFVESGKALVLLDGNQPGVGKTLLARTIGVVLDGTEPDLIRYNPIDEELEKRICAGLRYSESSVILVDNAKVRAGDVVSSVVLEAQSVAPQVNLRILGTSTVYRRPNDLIWMLTMNNTRVSPDLISRSITIQFEFSGDPGKHNFEQFDPIAFARKNRNTILGELAGLVQSWTLQGRPSGRAHHRLREWVSVIGGILDSAGLSGFLENARDANTAFNPDLEGLIALAEAALESDRAPELISSTEGEDVSELGLKAGDIDGVLDFSSLVPGCDSTKKSQSQATKIGQYLSRCLDREVCIEHKGKSGKATLLLRNGRSNAKYYYFRVTHDETKPPESECSDCNDKPPPDCELYPQYETQSLEQPPPQYGNQEIW